MFFIKLSERKRRVNDNGAHAPFVFSCESQALGSTPRCVSVSFDVCFLLSFLVQPCILSVSL